MNLSTIMAPAATMSTIATSVRVTPPNKPEGGGVGGGGVGVALTAGTVDFQYFNVGITLSKPQKLKFVVAVCNNKDL
jgi:hypothetical protein